MTISDLARSNEGGSSPPGTTSLSSLPTNYAPPEVTQPYLQHAHLTTDPNAVPSHLPVHMFPTGSNGVVPTHQPHPAAGLPQQQSQIFTNMPQEGFVQQRDDQWFDRIYAQSRNAIFVAVLFFVYQAQFVWHQLFDVIPDPAATWLLQKTCLAKARFPSFSAFLNASLFGGIVYIFDRAMELSCA